MQTKHNLLGRVLGPSLLGHCKQKHRGLRGLLCRWPSITEWEVHITAQVSEMTYTVLSGTLKLYYTYLLGRGNK